MLNKSSEKERITVIFSLWTGKCGVHERFRDSHSGLKSPRIPYIYEGDPGVTLWSPFYAIRESDADLPTPSKGNLETHEKKILQKIVRFCFFPQSNPFSIEGSQQPHSQGLLPFQNGG